MSEAKLEAYFFTTLFICVLALTAYLFYPFIGALALAVVLATLGMPLYDRLLKVCKKRAGLAAFLVVFIMTGAILAPAVFLFFLLVDEVRTITLAATSLDLSALSNGVAFGEGRLREVFPLLAPLDIASVLQNSLQTVGTHLVAMLTNTAGAIFKLVVSIFALYYFLKDGRSFVRTFIQLSPLTDDEDTQIVEKLRMVSRSLVRGTLVIAVLQGGLTGLGFLFFNVPNPVLWGSVAAIGSLIPTLGTGIVAVPAVAYLVITGQYLSALGLTLWGFMIVGLADNMVRPYLIGSSTQMHPLFVLLSVLGGVAVFGVAGLLLGPMIFGLLVALSEIYKVKIKEIHRMSV